MRLVIATAVAILTTTSVVRTQIPATFKNLQLLPKDIPRMELIATMKGFAMQLGVRCEHCHVGEGDDLSKFDFAADTKPTKATARKMILMSRALNEQVTALDVPPAPGATPTPGPKITCYTCHRGEKKPKTAPGGGD
jgi:thioredoxin reductase